MSRVSFRNFIFARPYRGLPAFVFAFFVLCFALHPQSPFFTHHLADPDDYMRLQQVSAWLGGQSWYDLAVPRMGADTIVHWSRLIDMPIAAVALPFISAFGVTDALMIASFIVPLVWLGVLFYVLPRMARLAVGADRANIACVLFLFMPLLAFNFTPGRVDHHGAQTIIALFGLISLSNIIMQKRGVFFAVASALCFAGGFWIGAEALPWAILFVACLAIAAAWLGEGVQHHAAVFGVALPVFTAALVPIALPVSELSSRAPRLALSWFSPAYVIFAALSGGVLVAGYFLSRFTDNKYIRLVFYKLLGLTALIVFFAVVPSALNGPFTDYDNFDATTALDNIGEAMPLVRGLHINYFMPASFVPAMLCFLRLLLLPLLALGVCLWKARHARDAKRLMWVAQFIFLFAAFCLTVFWQMRVGIFMEIFSVAPLTALLCACWDQLKSRLRDRSLHYAEVGVFLCLGFLPVIFIPALIHATPLYPDVMLFPAARGIAQCPLEPIIPFLNETDGLGAKPLTILNSSDTGPQILFATRHNVIAGNFDVAGNATAFAFFHAMDDNEAHRAAVQSRADIVLVCRIPPLMYLGADYYAPGHTHLATGEDGMLHFANRDARQPLIQRLIRGQIPVWLKKIEIPVPSDYLIYRIQPVAGDK